MMPNSGALQAVGEASTWTMSETPGQIEISQPGYLAVWTANKRTAQVYYDKIKLTYYKGTVLEEDHYYPFGLTLSSPSSVAAEKNKYKLTTKELQDEFGLNIYDFGARMYDMQIGKWMQHDPLSESFYHHSPYAYCDNNPVRLIDPSGMGEDSYLYNNETGNFLGKIEDDLPDAAVVLSVDPAKEGNITAGVNRLNNRGEGERNAVATGLRMQGRSYDVNAFSNYYEQNKNVRATRLDDNTEVSDLKNIQLNGRPYIPMAEVIGNLVNKNGMITVGNSSPVTQGDMTSSHGGKLAPEPNMTGEIHLHPLTGGTVSYEYKNRPGTTTISPQAGPSKSGNNGQISGDYGTWSKYQGSRNVMVDSKNIYLYNNKPAQTIKIPRTR